MRQDTRKKRGARKGVFRKRGCQRFLDHEIQARIANEHYAKAEFHETAIAGGLVVSLLFALAG
jgi:hypothetical protein